jgi:hypothetical protein
VAGSPLANEQFEHWPEVGLDSNTYHRFMVDQMNQIKKPSTSTTVDRIERELLDEALRELLM